MRHQLALTARSAAYVLMAFPLALAVWIGLPLGFSLGIGLLPVFLLGLPILAATVLALKAFARAERRRAAVVLGEPIAQPPEPARVPGEPAPGLSARWRRRLNDPMTWRELGWAGVLALPGLIAASILLALASGALVLFALPFAAIIAPDGTTLQQWPVAFLMPLAGVLAVAITGAAARLMGEGLAAAAKAILSPDEKALLAARVETLETTRAGAVESADATLRRIERDLHDGAQHRLAYVAMELGRARGKLDNDPEGARDLVERAHDESKRAMAELRDLVRGVHPSVLADRGLAAAVSGIAGRSPIPVAVKVAVEPRPGRAAEAAAYFVVAEALANVGRHSGATHADVEITREYDRLTVVIADDGHGGATAGPGGGLAGLAQRVEALDGHFGVVSNPGEGTTVWAELPCGS
jgi:signal transduction histidine kinase